MKKLIILLALLVISFAAMAQQDRDSHYGWADHATFFAQPKIKGDISKIIVTHSEVDLYVIAIYEFNIQGDVLSLKQFTRNGELIDSIEYSYDYDKGEVNEKHYNKGVLTYEDTYVIADNYIDWGALDIEDTSEYKYDAEGRVVEQVEKFKDGVIRTTYEYDAKGNKSKITTEQTGEPTVVQDYKYDEHGNVVDLVQTPGNYYSSSHTKYDIIYRY
jgi:hypothetical protein